MKKNLLKSHNHIYFYINQILPSTQGLIYLKYFWKYKIHRKAIKIKPETVE